MKRLLIFLVVFLPLISCNEEENDAVGSPSGFEIPASAVTELETEEDLDVLLNEIGDSRYVLLGEASHGTAEYYTWRASITKRLIQEKGFTIIAVEGDWPAAYQLNRYIRRSGTAARAEDVLRAFERWPTWMWANEEIADLSEWLRTHNSTLAAEKRVGFYGLDVYSLWESMDAVQQYLQQENSNAAEALQEAFACLAPYNRDEQAYGRAMATASESCADELENLLQAMQEEVGNTTPRDEAAFNALQNALVAVNAEQYYRTAARNNVASWNIRDQHMVETINNLMEQYGPDAKVVVWEHNTHVGDARYTDMADQGMVNVGQLVREEHETQGVYIIGFSSYTGTVIAAPSWGAPLQALQVPEARPGSWEDILHRQPPLNKIINLKELRQDTEYLQRRGHRAIGVVYNPNNEGGNYVPTVLPERYDALIFLDRTTALHPLD